MISKAILQQAIYCNYDVLPHIDYTLFADRHEQAIAKYISKTFVENQTINIDLLRSTVNADKYQLERREILDKLNYIENEVFAFSDEMIDDFGRFAASYLGDVEDYKMNPEYFTFETINEYFPEVVDSFFKTEGE